MTFVVYYYYEHLLHDYVEVVVAVAVVFIFVRVCVHSSLCAFGIFVVAVVIG